MWLPIAEQTKMVKSKTVDATQNCSSASSSENAIISESSPNHITVNMRESLSPIKIDASK